MSQTEQDRNDSKWLILHSKLNEQRIKEAFRIFREEGIEPVLIKGWAAARFYPQKHERFYTDIDLCVEPEIFQKATLLLEDKNVKKLFIDLHKGFRHLDTVSWANLFENSKLVNLDESEIRVLRDEDHLRILCVHWLNDGGVDRKKLLDIFYSVENRPADFDWERCLGVVSGKRRRWIVCTIGLTRKYFGLSLKGTPIEQEAEKLPKWLIKTIEREWKRGVKLKPLLKCLNDGKQLLEQIRRRIPPNPIQATVELEGSFDERPRIFYQIANTFTRMIPLIKRIKMVLDARRNSTE
jgi:hypothetical protein